MATLLTVPEAVKQVVDDPVIRGVYTADNDDPASFFNLMGPVVPSGGGSSKEGTLQTSAFAGVARSEGDVHSAPQEIAYERPSISYASCMFDGTITATEHLKAALKGDRAAWFPVIARQALELMRGIMDSFHGRWVGATYDGIRLAVSPTGTYKGLDHATITGWASGSATLNAPNNLSAMDTARTTLLGPERRKAGGFNKVLWGINQEQRYLAFYGAGVRPNVTVNVANGEQPVVDLGDSREKVMYGGRQCIAVPDFLTTSIMFVNTDDFEIVAHEEEAGNGGWKVQPSAVGAAHKEDTNIAGMFLMDCKDPFRQYVILLATA